MKNLLSAWNSGEKAEFYCDVEPPDFSAADNYFRVTDMQMMSAFAMKRANHIFRAEDMIENEAHTSRSDAAKSPSRIPLWLKKGSTISGLSGCVKYCGQSAHGVIRR